ncbi:MAG: alkene reductase [Lysobacterales bacterium CG02_land_8_20_14_3_00_62_12]|nr:MAG: alkene reductase [Xanthomonadales bacterium CG02_land_8_20_14_3_00_62_12]
MTSLFSPLSLGDITLPNRLVMAPLTRARAGGSHLPNALMAEYYAQRASAGLLIAEATMVAADGCAFTGEPGIYDAACADGWRQVTGAVHANGGRIQLQLWHPGRAAHSALNGGSQPISSSAKAIRGDTIHTPNGAEPYQLPRPLATAELAGIVELFAAAAERAKAAGFDGVQIHGAHGYLIDQFLRDGVNDRDDAYGGGIENRARLLLQVVDAAMAVWGPARVSVRISPLVGFNDMVDSDPSALVAYVAQELSRRQLGFLELRHADQQLPAEQSLAKLARQHFPGVLMLNGGFDPASAAAAVSSGRADAIAFGRAFLANPDLVERSAHGAELNAIDTSTLYTPGPKGYTDYPRLDATISA